VIVLDCSLPDHADGSLAKFVKDVRRTPRAEVQFRVHEAICKAGPFPSAWAMAKYAEKVYRRERQPKESFPAGAIFIIENGREGDRKHARRLENLIHAHGGQLIDVDTLKQQQQQQQHQTQQKTRTQWRSY
jgi:hypothetical protein